MGKVLKFHLKPHIDEKTASLLRVSDEIDTLVAEAIFDNELDPKDVAGLLAHRLGSLIRQLDLEDREKLLEVCQDVLEKQALRKKKPNKVD